MGVSRKNYYKNTLVYMAYESSYWNKSFSTQISLELLAVLIVPMYGKDKAQFLESAQQILSKVYNNNGVIFKAHALRGTGGVVRFLAVSNLPRGASSDHLEHTQKASSYIVLSHMGLVDGPILSDESGTAVLDNQPWAVAPGTDNLQMAGAVHWTTVGRSRNNSVTIMLLGCDSAVSYGKIVARAAQSTVWGFSDSCSSGIPEFSVKAVKSIEGGTVTKILRRIQP